MSNKSLMVNFELFISMKKNVKKDDVALFSRNFEKMFRTENNSVSVVTLLMLAIASRSYNIIRFLYSRIGVGNLNKEVVQKILNIAIERNDIILFKIFKLEFGEVTHSNKRGYIL